MVFWKTYLWAKSNSGQPCVGIPGIKQSIFTTQQLAEYFRLFLKLNAALHCCSENIKSIMYGGCNLPTKADQEFHCSVCVCLLWENRMSKALLLVMFSEQPTPDGCWHPLWNIQDGHWWKVNVHFQLKLSVQQWQNSCFVFKDNTTASLKTSFIHSAAPQMQKILTHTQHTRVQKTMTSVTIW